MHKILLTHTVSAKSQNSMDEKSQTLQYMDITAVSLALRPAKTIESHTNNNWTSGFRRTPLPRGQLDVLCEWPLSSFILSLDGR